MTDARLQLSYVLQQTLAGALALLAGCKSDAPQPVVVYCAHDSVYSEDILKQFEQQSGIPVSIKFDTEATKSIGLTNLLIAEKANPRCDVFWNNQAQSTVQLQEEGVLVPYQGAGFKRIPAAFKDPEGRWVGFGARLRVFIVNTDKMPATAEAIEERLKSDDLSRVAMAKPLFGTTLTEYTVRWHAWGPEKLKEWHKDLPQRTPRQRADQRRGCRGGVRFRLD
jgi:iron(III) transport system substrate-binding protein